jgi:hypothetical protein
MKFRRIFLSSVALAAASLGFAQSATLSGDKSSVASDAELTLTFSATYAGAPGAMGWSVSLPEGRSYVSTSGSDIPAIAPQAGATGTLEWAHTYAPVGVAHFRFTVKAAGKPGEAQLKGTLLLRAAGKQQTIESAPVGFDVAR